MQLHRLIPRRAAAFSGTPEAPAGVVSPDDAADTRVVPAPAPRSRAGAREWLLMAAVAWSLLGLGERCRVDPRFTSPSSTLGAYWEALRAGDDEAIAECLIEGPHDLPFPGMLWFLPPTRMFRLEHFRSLPVQSGRVMVTYEVHYLPQGAREEQTFRTGNELVRTRGEWRIAKPLGEAGMPEWRPVHHTFDI